MVSNTVTLVAWDGGGVSAGLALTGPECWSLFDRNETWR